LRDVHAAAELPTPIGVAPVAQAPETPVPVEPDARLGQPPQSEHGFNTQGTPLDSQRVQTPVVPPVDPGYTAQGDPLSGATSDPYGYYMTLLSPVNAGNTRNMGVRIVAYIIDFILTGVVQSVIGLMVGMVVGMSALTTGGDPTATAESAPVNLTLYGLGTLVFFGYFIIMEAVFGYTLGKRLFGLRVVNENGEPISWGQSFGRNLMRIVDLLFWGLVAIISMNTSELCQRLGDRVANTYVIR
jgi:uncharacterized RDD family membrane protein YckC